MRWRVTTESCPFSAIGGYGMAWRVTRVRTYRWRWLARLVACLDNAPGGMIACLQRASVEEAR